jgi:EAL domain
MGVSTATVGKRLPATRKRPTERPASNWPPSSTRSAPRGSTPPSPRPRITESVLMDDVATTIGAISALKGLGVTLSIDDFGTGYSSLGYLKRFPVDAVKVDRSFIDGLGADPEDSAIVAAVVSLGHALGLTVIAEGVETARQLAGALQLGLRRGPGIPVRAPGSRRRPHRPRRRRATRYVHHTDRLVLRAVHTVETVGPRRGNRDASSCRT